VLDAFIAEERARGAVVVRLDCRAVEPTPAGFLHEVGTAIGIPSRVLSTAALAAAVPSAAPAAEVTRRLGGLGERVLLALDNYEVFRLLDAWLRTTFVASLEDNLRVVLVGRDPPVPGWLTAPRWQVAPAVSLPCGPDGFADYEDWKQLANLALAQGWRVGGSV
jgi:hypothetical protein